MDKENLHRIDVTGKTYSEIITDCAEAIIARLSQYRKELNADIHPTVQQYYEEKALQLLEIAPKIAPTNMYETRKALAVVSAIMDTLSPGEDLTFCQHPELKQLGYWYNVQDWDVKTAELLGANISKEE